MGGDPGLVSGCASRGWRQQCADLESSAWARDDSLPGEGQWPTIAGSCWVPPTRPAIQAVFFLLRRTRHLAGNVNISETMFFFRFPCCAILSVFVVLGLYRFSESERTVQSRVAQECIPRF